MATKRLRQSFTNIYKSRAAQAGRWISQARDALASWVDTAAGREDRNRFTRAYNAYQRENVSLQDGIRKVNQFRTIQSGASAIQAQGLRPEHVGGLYLYVYKAKFREELPYWDAYPLIFLFNTAPLVGGKPSGKHFMGLNLHYIRPRERALLMDALNDRLLRNGFDPNHERFDRNLYSRISYSVLQAAANHRQFSPCVKMYLKSHVRSSLIKVPGDQWHNVLFLPIARFQKKKDSYVWSESARNTR